MIDMKNLSQKYNTLKDSPRIALICKIGIGFGLLSLSQLAFSSDDLLAGTTTQAIATMNGTGRYWAYIIDGVISIAAFAKTKNPWVFFSVLGVALGITAIVKMAGGGAG